MNIRDKAIAIALLASLAFPAAADITIGVTVSATGPGAALGLPQKNTVALVPSSLNGEKINLVVLDDATDPTNAARNASKFINELKVDAIIGSSTTTNTAAIAEAASQAKTPLLGLAPLELSGAKDKWIFKMPQHNGVMGKALVEHMQANGVKTIGFIGFADVFGELWLRDITPMLVNAGIKLVAVERFNRVDTSVTGQVLKIISANPDAVLVVAGGSPAVLPHVTLVERGYKGRIYQTHGAPSSVFLKLGGKNVEGGIFVAGPLLVWDQLPDSAPTKKVAADYAKRYEEKYGAGSLASFGGHLWDAWLLLEHAIPVALKKARPGTEQFRIALRDALEASKEVVGVHGVYNMSPTDHFGHDERSRVLLRVENNAFKRINYK